ncbi:Tomoregulin-2 [Turdus rufiventris]|nr:Tomoregulin-2 [Turdus rufiventris]
MEPASRSKAEQGTSEFEFITSTLGHFPFILTGQQFLVVLGPVIAGCQSQHQQRVPVSQEQFGGAGSVPDLPQTKLDILEYEASSDGAAPGRCVCNIDCSQTNFNPLCASDGKSYDNACQIKEASCQKQEKIEVMSLGRCQDNTTTTTKSEDGHYARTDYAENANKLEESARGIYIPCPEHYNGFCMHGKCEHSTNMLEPSCRCDAGYTGQHCEKKDYSVLYVVPGPVRFQYVLIAAVIGTIQIAIICVVVLCITSSSGNFESTELSSRVLSWSKISDNYGCGKGEE